jgi:hypothetical protein
VKAITLLFLILFLLPFRSLAVEITLVEQADGVVRWEVPLTAAGFEPSVILNGQAVEQEFFIPVPTGMTVHELRAGLRVSPDVRSGFLEVSSQDRVLVSVDAREQEIVVPLEGVPVIDHQLALTLTARLRSEDDVCLTAYAGARMELVDAVLVLNEDFEAPTAVGTFMPSLLSKLTLYLQPQPTQGEAQAALELAAQIAQRYRSQNPTIEILPLAADQALPEALANNFAERSIVIREGEGAAMQLQSVEGGSVLVLTGTADSLSQNARLLTRSFASLASAETVQAVTVSNIAPQGGDRFTFQALEFNPLRTSGVGQLTLAYPLAQADFGGSLNSFSVHVAGTYTPLTSAESADLLVMIDDTLVEARALNDSGQFEVNVDIPDYLLRRDNTLMLRFEYTPPNGRCQIGANSFTAQIDPGSYVDVGRGQELPVSFARFPQTMLPEFSVALDEMTLTGLQNAARLVSAIQLTTRTPLHPVAVSWQDAASASRAALFVSSQPGTPGDLQLPLESDEGLRLLDADGEVLLELDAEVPFAALQAFRNNNQDALLLSGDAALADQLVSSLAEIQTNWYSLQGSIVLQTPSDRVDLNVTQGGLEVQPLAEEEDAWWVEYRYIFFGAALLVILLMLAAAYPRVVRKAPQ